MCAALLMNQTVGLHRASKLGWLINWLYPPVCRFCSCRLNGQDEECFCHSCRDKVRLVAPPLCPLCGRPFLDGAGEDHLCGSCLVRSLYFVRARAWACYPGDQELEHPLREVLQRFKYGRKESLGKPLGRLMARGCAQFFHECTFDAIIPVPLHSKRLRWRGFNQAVLLAREVSRLWGIPMDPFVLARSRDTSPQTQLPEEERRKNVRGVFSLSPNKSAEGMTLLLVDDVYTSGATVNECSRTLVRAGAKEVYVLTLARTVL